MKIVCINSVCDVGSTGRIAANMCREAMKNGHECIVAYGRGKCSATDIKTIKIGSEIDVAVHGILSRCFDFHGFGSQNATKKFLAELEKFKPDTMYIHNLHGYYINIELLFKYIKDNNIKVIWTLHDAWSITGHCAWDESYNCDQWKNGCEHCEHRKQYPRCDFFSNSKKNYIKKKNAFTGVKDLTIVTPSKWMANLIKDSFLKEYPVIVKYNTVNTDIFKKVNSDFRTEYGLNDDTLFLCVVFAANKRKLEALFKFSMMLGRNEKLIIVGLGEKNLQRAKEYKNILSFARTDSQRQLVEIYSACDVFVNPTYADNYPTVNLESEACGTPVICYDVGGCRETLHLPLSKCIPVGNLELLLTEARAAAEHRRDNM